MIDIHSHLIFGIGDGPGTMDESMRMVHAAEKLGIRTIIATPHYGCFAVSPERALNNYQMLVYTAERESCVDIRMGYENCSSFIGCNFAPLAGLTLDNSRYMLVELPQNFEPADSIDILYSLQVKNVLPIIAHPERNTIFFRNFEIFSEFIKRGYLVQLDGASIAGKYGRKQKRFARKIIKLRIAHFISSNAHSAEDYDDYARALKKVRNWAGMDYADKLLLTNGKLILTNIQKSIYEMI